MSSLCIKVPFLLVSSPLEVASTLSRAFHSSQLPGKHLLPHPESPKPEALA